MNPRWPMAVALAILAPIGARSAAESPLDRSDEAARERFTRLSATYKAIASYEDRGAFTRTVKIAGKEHTETSPLSIRFRRPDRLALDAGEVRVLSDGTAVTTVLGPTKRYLVTPSKGSLNLTEIADGPAGALLLGGASGPPAQLLLRLLTGVEPASALPDRATRVRTETDVTLDGRVHPALRVDLGNEPPLRVILDPETSLIRRMDYVIDPRAASDRLPKEAADVADLSLAWTSGTIRTEPIPDASFRFTPPEGFERMKAAEAARPKAK